MLCDSAIRAHLDAGDLVIDPPPDDSAIQPASVDLRLDAGFILLRADDYHEQPGATQLLLEPGDCVLASTVEHVSIPRDMVGRVEGKSTWGRRFLQVHSTAGFIDPGFTGQITLELKNCSPKSIFLWQHVRIAQISFDYLDRYTKRVAPRLVTVARRPYGTDGLDSHYQGQTGVTLPYTEEH